MPDGITFSCSACAQQFGWSPGLAGRKMRCACGAVLVVPEMQLAPVPAELEFPAPELIPVAGDPEPGQLALDEAGREIQPTKVAPSRVLNYQKGGDSRRERFRDPIRARRRDVLVPIALLLICILVLTGLCLGSPHSLALIVRQTLLRLGWDVMMTAAAFVVVAQFVDALNEDYAITALKLAALATTRFTLWAMIGLNSDYIVADFGGFCLSALPFAVLLTYFFQLDFSNTCLAAVLMTFLRWISYFGLWQML